MSDKETKEFEKSKFLKIFYQITAKAGAVIRN
jgi:hypothetical protein